MIAVDGTKVHANASQHATRDYEQIAARSWPRPTRSIAPRTSATASARGDELPPELSTAQGRRGWLREAKRRLEERRAEEARPIPGPRPQRLQEAKRRLEEEHRVECQANAAYEAYRARGRMKDGRRFGRPPDPHEPPATPAGKVNLTDPDSRNVKTPRGWVQGYNAQAVVHREPDRDRRRGDDRLTGLRAPRTDDRGRRTRARRGRDHRDARGRARRRRLLAPGADGAAHRPRHRWS